MDNFALMFGIVLLGTCIIAIAIPLIKDNKYKEFLLNIKTGDIFIWDSIDNYNRLNNLDDDNPFVSPKIKDDVIYYPTCTIIIRDVKKNDKGILWAAYTFIETSDDIKNKKYLLYRELEDLIENRIKIN